MILHLSALKSTDKARRKNGNFPSFVIVEIVVEQFHLATVRLLKRSSIVFGLRNIDVENLAQYKSTTR